MRKLALLFFITINAFVCNAHKKNSSQISKGDPVKGKSVISAKATSSAVFPIIAWVGLPQYFTTLAKYQELKASGMTQSYCPFTDSNAMEAALNMAQKVGIKLFVACPELTSKPEETVKRFMNHPALAGYYISDEPGASAFPGLSLLIKRIEAIDKKHLCYVNLFPNYAVESQLGTKTYSDYVNIYMQQVSTKIISFDHYPVIGDKSESIRPEWYHNLEIIADAAKKYNKPFWAFALSVAFSPYPLPTLASLRLQVYSDLAYGAQAIQYFTYFTLTDPNNNFNNAPLDPQGKLTVSYGRVQQMNKEIKSLSGVFLGAKMISVAHTGNTIPFGTKSLTKLPKPIKSLKTQGLGAVVSVLKKNGISYMVIVNRDIASPMNLQMVCGTGVSRVLKNGSVAAIKSNTRLSVGPGDVSIYKWADALN